MADSKAENNKINGAIMILLLMATARELGCGAMPNLKKFFFRKFY